MSTVVVCDQCNDSIEPSETIVLLRIDIDDRSVIEKSRRYLDLHLHCWENLVGKIGK